ncbi:MAG: hypothetical protein UR68_C0004G0006 [Candidatus Roizmanbacteria bacterium GW2011_GWA2_35_19]|uniref:Uncharacterized protein n=2 Tax=Candidatus Roizmaniibacteriota TaxID=1752723 RepID=A0A0G0BVX4_9BACT|nr:MAG: hypothetical protein UR63_C0026G0005 [Candidatus Roizmanbacteria bacterium GW2011_GWC2_35_12]KKP73453.1 MAG: hypothetical protein UR68_C0004G0006 [Candidatus Roizmanbacteria bacterium GW2011_GWA2_35_19]
MSEIPLRIPGRAGMRDCHISSQGRITLEEAFVNVEDKGIIKEPFFTATLPELKI